LALITALAGPAIHRAHAQPTEEWVARFSGQASGEDLATALAVDQFDNVFVTGGQIDLSTDAHTFFRESACFCLTSYTYLCSFKYSCP
jgi:hypothetical protein